MNETQSSNRLRLVAVFGLVFILLISVSCNFAQLIFDQIDLDRTSTAWARETEWAQTATEEARLYNSKTATAQQKAREAWDATETVVVAATETQQESDRLTEAAPKPPVITSIDFPAEIPGNKSTMIGLLYFQDPDGDVKQVNYSVIRAEEFGAGVDNEPKLDHGTWENGAIKIYLWCEGQQTVTLEAMVIDYAGNASNPMRFTFACK